MTSTPSPNHAYPTSLTKTADRFLEIVWSDEMRQRIPFRVLRESCPCATCREKSLGAAAKAAQALGQLPVLSPAEAKPLDIVSMRPVGNYAYGIHFSDGHATGLFTFEWLRKLS